MPDTESSMAFRCASATGRQVITAAEGGGYVSAGVYFPVCLLEKKLQKLVIRNE